MESSLKVDTEDAATSIDFPMSTMLPEVNGNGGKKSLNDDTNSISMLTNYDTLGSNTKSLNRYIKTKFLLDKVTHSSFCFEF